MLSTANRVFRSAAEAAAVHPSWIQRAPARPRGHEQARTGNTRVQRAVNVAVALVGIIVTAPIMLVVAILVLVSSPGPVLYRQTRVGIDRRTSRVGKWRRVHDWGGRLFTIYKFRTMYVPKAEATTEVWARPDDPRITPIGAFLRKSRLDELPQLFNVLKGDMNVVGPRPEQPTIFVELREKIDRYSERQRVMPGITGWAQINQQYDQNLDDVRRKVQLDLEYAARTSALEDLRIILRTLPVMLFRRGGW